MTAQQFLRKWMHRFKETERDDFIADVKELLRPPGKTIFMETVVSHRNMRPIVNCKMGSFEFQLSPEEARKIGADFLEIAGGAETDAFVFQFLSGKVGIPMDTVAQFLGELRRWRQDRDKALEEPAPKEVQ